MIFYPDQYKKQVLPKGFFAKDLLAKKNLTLKQNAIQALLISTDLEKKELAETVAGVVNVYQNKIDDLREEGLPKAKASVIAKGNEQLLKQRIENLVVFSKVLQIKKENKGKFYKWLPSGANEPDPEHQLLYGKTFPVGEGDDQGNMPAERYGCQCGMEILDSEKNS